MQNLVGKIMGVSPAWSVSRYGTGFTCNDLLPDFALLRALGFGAVQLEIFEEAVLPAWQNGGMEKVIAELAHQGMTASVFVAHFLGNCFASPEALERTAGQNRAEEVLRLMEGLEDRVPLAVPLLPFVQNGGSADPFGIPGVYGRPASLLLKEWSLTAADYGRELILEIVPGSLAGSYRRFLTEPVWAEVRDLTGFLLDTGHAHVAGDDPVLLPGIMREKLKGLHISDNDGEENLSLPPGRGSIEWDRFLEELEASGYRGSLDLEIGAGPESAEALYREGQMFFMNLENYNRVKE